MSQPNELILVNTSTEEDILEGTFSKFGYRISSRSIGSAKRRKILVTVPYMNGHYDFSFMPISNDARYQQNIYDNRTFTYVVQIPAEDAVSLNNKFIDFNNWLCLGVTRRFRDTTMPSLEWYGEVADTVLVEKVGYGEVTITMSVYPFAHSIFYEGCKLWDETNFEIDYVQDLEFTMPIGSVPKTIYVMNVSSIIQNPKIYYSGSSGKIKMTVSDLSATMAPGYNVASGLVLHPGLNIIKMEWVETCTDTNSPYVQFIWQKEMI